MNTTIYVDQKLIIAIAAKLVGVLRQESKGTSGSISLNWLIQSSVSADNGIDISRDVRELLPEDVVHLVYNHIQNKYINVSKCVDAMANVGDDQLFPGSVLSVQGGLSFPDLNNIPQYDPFNPPNINVRTFSVHGESCFAGQLASDGFVLPAYFLESAKDQVAFCSNEPVEILGITRWSPPYRPGGAKSLTKIIRVAAVLLR